MDVFAGITFDSLTSDTSTTSSVSKTGTSTATAYSSSSTSSSKTGSSIGFYSSSGTGSTTNGLISIKKTSLYKTNVDCPNDDGGDGHYIGSDACDSLVFDCDSISYGDSYSFCSAGQYLVGCKTDSNGNNVAPISASSSDNTALKNCLLYGGECDTCPSPGTSASATKIYIRAGTCCRVAQYGYQQCTFSFQKINGASTTSVNPGGNTIITLDKCYSTTGSDATGYFEWVDTNLIDKQCYYDTTN